MAYTPQTWSDSPSTATPITAARLTVMEDGIAAAQAGADRSGGVLPDFISGLYYWPTSNAAAFSGMTTYTANRLYAVPLVVAVPTTFSRIAIRSNVTGTGQTVRLGLYGSGTTGLPDALVVDAGTVTVTGAAGLFEITIALSLAPAVYWVTVVSTTVGVSLAGLGTASFRAVAGDATGAAAMNAAAYLDGVSGALPSSFGTPTGYTVGTVLIAALKVA